MPNDDQWDGIDRRQQPHEYQMRAIIREELKPVIEEQHAINEKIASWEFGASIFRYFILTTIGLIATAASIWEWAKEHLR